MNTATRVIARQNIEMRSPVFHITRPRLLIFFLVVTLLCSAFGVIYFKDLNRRLFIQYKSLQHEKAEELIEWGKLLLEQSTWSTQSRIQQMAQRKLGMEIPSMKKVILVNANNDTTVIR